MILHGSTYSGVSLHGHAVQIHGYANSNAASWVNLRSSTDSWLNLHGNADSAAKNNGTDYIASEAAVDAPNNDDDDVPSGAAAANDDDDASAKCQHQHLIIMIMKVYRQETTNSI